MTTTDAMTDDDRVVTWWGLVIEGYHATQNRLAAEVADRHGLPMPSLDILLRLLRSPGRRQPMTRLAKEAALTSGGFTKVADRLVAAGLIRREPCETDRRVVHVTLTEQGLELAEQAKHTTAEVLRTNVLDPLGKQGTAALAQAMRMLRAANAPDFPAQ